MGCVMADKLKHDDGFADADARLESGLLHQPQNITGALVDGMRDGFDIQNYSGLYADEMTKIQADRIRGHLERKGFRRLDPARDPEVVIAAAGCEVWIRSNKAKEFAIQDRRDHARCEGRWDGKSGNPHGARTWKDMQRLRMIGTRHWD